MKKQITGAVFILLCVLGLAAAITGALTEEARWLWVALIFVAPISGVGIYYNWNTDFNQWDN